MVGQPPSSALCPYTTVFGSVEAVFDGVAGREDERAAERLDQAIVLQRQMGDRAKAGDLIAVIVQDVGGGDRGDQGGVVTELDRACAGELEGGHVELQRAAGVDLDAVGGVEVVDDDRGRAHEV